MAPAQTAFPRIAALIAISLWLLPETVFAQPVTQPFTFSISGHNLPAIEHGSADWGDIDGDGDLDLLLAGSISGSIATQLMVNDGLQEGTHRFRALQGPLQSVLYSSSSFADVDGDGDLDVLVSGSTTAAWPYAASTRLYRLSPQGTMTLIENSGLPDLHSASSAWADMDGDGDLDVVMTGVTSADELTTVVGYNDGNGTFETHTDLLPGIGYGDVALGDVDGDLDVDVVLSGASDDGFMTRVLRNDGETFSASGAAFPAVAFSSVDLGDYDGDGDLDLVVSGGSVSELIFEGHLEIWDNTGGAFTASSHALPGVLTGEVVWGDYDHDGDLDLLVYGAEAAIGRRSAYMYRNDGDEGFRAATLLVGGVFSDASFGDFDGDGDLDLITTGTSSLGPSFTNIYENKRQVIPALPAAPSLLVADVNEREVQLSWQAPATDTGAMLQTTYNVRIGTRPGASDVVSAMADATTGRRWTSGPGNAYVSKAFAINELGDGTYYWSVQAVNNAFLASEFAAEGSFAIQGGLSVDTEASVLPERFAVYSNYPNPFSTRTTVRYDLPEAAPVRLTIYSLLGQEVDRVELGVQPAGEHHVEWDGRSAGAPLGSGIYFYEVRAAGHAATGTMTLVR